MSTNGESQVQARSAELSVRYAGFWYRALAALIDTVLVNVTAFFVVIPLAISMGLSMSDSSSAEEIEAAGQGLGFLLSMLIQWLWFTIGESSSWQGSVGKKMLGLRVTDEKGRRISFGRANGRYWGKIVSALILFIGFLMAAFTERKQALHDKMAGTLVIKAR
ncbi:RDD family protein [Burkholderiaceae bacterium FT117]|uniref:RDD family protein n=1 Tax=Zeimonas sediminis TaxID=2944268 RepID=UPI002342FE2C|nr:RDD family protein [Zeimonas sediminis]MCM5570059.1 RDD family protein [Zeimonas sediminis]